MNSKKSFERLLNHKCEIYHYGKKTDNKGYGITTKEDGYSKTPDLTNVKCHLHAETTNVVQNEPHQDIIASRKVDFPIGTDIRLNDMVVYNGLKYFAEVPNNVRNHHIVVVLQRKGKESWQKSKSIQAN